MNEPMPNAAEQAATRIFIRHCRKLRVLMDYSISWPEAEARCRALEEEALLDDILES